MDRTRLLIWTVSLTAVFTGVCWGVHWLRGESFVGAFTRGLPILDQLLIGGVAGASVSLGGFLMLGRSTLFQGYFDRVDAVFETLDPKPRHLILAAVCAGWGEELFFRAVLQPWLGWVGASVAFWLAHGAVSRTNLWVNLYGLALLGAGLGLGALYEHMGLVSAIAAHIAVDVVSMMGFYLRRKQQG